MVARAGGVPALPRAPPPHPRGPLRNWRRPSEPSPPPSLPTAKNRRSSSTSTPMASCSAPSRFVPPTSSPRPHPMMGCSSGHRLTSGFRAAAISGSPPVPGVTDPPGPTCRTRPKASISPSGGEPRPGAGKPQSMPESVPRPRRSPTGPGPMARTMPMNRCRHGSRPSEAGLEVRRGILRSSRRSPRRSHRPRGRMATGGFWSSDKGSFP